jgi:serine/threonine protein kinase
VNLVKRLVEGQDVHFMELKEMMLQVAQMINKQQIASSVGGPRDSASSRSVPSEDLARWAMQEVPFIDKKDVLGSGSFGVVYGGSYMQKDAAFKVLNSVASSSNDLLKEVKLHLKVSACPGVVQILAVDLQVNKFTRDPCIVMERAAGSLHDYIHPRTNHNIALPPINLSLPGKLTLLEQIASCLEYISSAGLVHRDIKSSNVLIFIDKITGDVVAKICDFGLSKSVGGSVDMSSRVSVKGTPTYLAPEAFDMEYSSASDMYAYGILLNETLTEQFPIPVTLSTTSAPSIPQLVKAVCTNGLRPALFDEPSIVGDALRKLVNQCWHQERASRCTFSTVTVELGHILEAALDVARFGSRGVDTNKLMQSLRISPIATFSPASSVASAISQSAETSPANLSSSTTVQMGGTMSSTKSLSELSVEEVGSLMSSLGLHQLKDTFVSKSVNGLMLSYCEEVDDLKSAEYGVSNNAIARGLLKTISDWKVNDVSL